MPGGPVLLWTAVVALGLVDLAACLALGLSFTRWFPFLPIVLGIAALGLGYHLTGRSARIASMTNWVLLWLVFSLFGAILTYVVAARGADWRDAEFAAIDAALGLDWMAGARFVARHPLLERVLALAYESLMPQILISAIYFAYRGREDINCRLLSNAFLALLLTVGGFSLLPALGPWVYYLQSPAAYDFYLRDLQGVHDRTLMAFAIPELKGIICLPSYHTVLAILLTYAYWRSPLFIPVALLNGLMLVAIPFEGGHYFIDVFAGAAVAGLTIVATNALAQRQRRPRLPYPAPAAPSPFRPEAEVR